MDMIANNRKKSYQKCQVFLNESNQRINLRIVVPYDKNLICQTIPDIL